MSSQSMESFLEACGAAGPVSLTLEGPDSLLKHLHLDQPAILIGRHSRADVVLDHDDVSQRHAYLQVVGGRLLCFDLESRTGTRTEQGRRCPAWLGPAGTIQIGPYRLRAWIGKSGHARDADVSPVGPISSSPARAGDRLLVRATLQILGEKGISSAYPLRRAVTLFGGSSLCDVQIRSANASKFSGALVRTPDGVWLADLRSTAGVRVNGRTAHHKRLSEGDELRVGRHAVRITYDDQGSEPAPREQPGRSGLAIPESAILSAAPALFPSADWPSPATGELQPLLHQVALMQQQMCDQFQHVILVMSQMFGSMHRDHLGVLREELEQIRRLTEEIQALREASPTRSADPDSPSTSPAPPPNPGATPPPLGIFPGALDSDVTIRPRLEPEEIHAVVGEKLAAFERERQSRWDRILKILTNA